jgi:septation ring formation regulator EzrA
MMTLAAVTIEFGFTVLSWLITSIGGALLGAFAYGKIVGAKQKGIDARIAEESAARKAALELEASARKAELNMESAARKSAIDTEAAARKAALETEALARSTALVNESEGRRRLHGEVDEMKSRLREGDARFTEGVGTLAELTTRMENVTARIENIDSRQGQTRAKPDCDAIHARQEAECKRRHDELQKQIESAGKARH